MGTGVAGLGWFVLSDHSQGLADLLASVSWQGMAWPLARMLAFVAVGLVAGQVLEGLGLNARIGAFAAPLMKRAHLPPESGTAFAAAFASGVTANTLLYTSWQEGKLSRGQLIISNLLNASLPAYLLHLPTTFFVVLGILGPPALIYFGLTLAAAVLRFLGAALVGRLVLTPAKWTKDQTKPERKPWPQVWRETKAKFLVRFRRMLVIILPVYFVVYLLAQGGALAAFGLWLSTWVTSSLFSLEAFSVVVFSVMAESTSGYAAGAALLQAGSLEVKQVVIALLVGNMLATPIRMLRHQLPYYLGIFSPGLGGFLVGVGQVSRVTSILLVTLGYAWLF